MRFNVSNRFDSVRNVRRGFSLVELTVVVLIMGILAAVTAPRMMHLASDYRADSAATRILADLKYAAKQARLRGQSETITFDAASERYSFSSVSDPNSSSGVYSVDLSEYPYQAKIQSASFNGNSTVTFDGYGFPDNSGKIVVESGDVVRTIKLGHATGTVTIGSN